MTLPAYQSCISPELALGRVVLVEGDTCSVSLDSRDDVVARRAAGCLLAPRPSDRVLVVLSDTPYILSVLAREERCAEVVLDGDARILARGGTLELAGDEGVALRARKVVSVIAGALRVHSARAELVAQNLHAVAVTARASFDDLGVLANRYEMVAKRIAERAQRVFRFVSELDQLRARHFDYRAERSGQLKAENVVVVARQVAKVDGEQIHVG